MLCCLCPPGCPVSTEEVLTQIHFSETDSSISAMLSPRASLPETLSLYPQSTAQEQETEPVYLKAIMIPFIKTYYNSELGHRRFQSDPFLSGTLGARRGGFIASGPVGLGGGWCDGTSWGIDGSAEHTTEREAGRWQSNVRCCQISSIGDRCQRACVCVCVSVYCQT